MTEAEFSEIISEYKEYQRMREKIRQQSRSQPDENLEKEIIDLLKNRSSNVRQNV